MKLAQFLCFVPQLSDEDSSAAHVLSDFPIHNRRRRRRIAGTFFTRHSRSQEIGRSAFASSSLRGDRFYDPTTIFAIGSLSAPTSMRKLVSDDDGGLNELIFSASSNTTPKASVSSSSASIFPSPESKEAAEVADKRFVLFFLLLSFIVMVLFGRIFAILWTASGLWFLPRRMPASGKPEIGISEMIAVAAPPPLSELQRKELFDRDKRRVVLEGFLGRSKRI